MTLYPVNYVNYVIVWAAIEILLCWYPVRRGKRLKLDFAICTQVGLVIGLAGIFSEGALFFLEVFFSRRP